MSLHQKYSRIKEGYTVVRNDAPCFLNKSWAGWTREPDDIWIGNESTASQAIKHCEDRHEDVSMKTIRIEQQVRLTPLGDYEIANVT